MAFETVIGLEVHAQLSTRSKIFCACSTAFGAAPNGNTCPVCTGMPGVLPVLNRKAVEFTIRTALATSCAVQRRSVFARKNYFYPDLPKAYQISQYELPIALRRPRRHRGRRGDEADRDHADPHGGGRREARPRRGVRRRAGVARGSQPMLRPPDGDRLRARHAHAGGGRRVPAAPARHPRLPRGVRREHGGGVVPVRRERLGSPGRAGGVRHEGRAEEHELLPQRREGARVRNPAAGRADRGRGEGGAGDAALGRERGRHRVDAPEGGGARLPVLPRPGPASADRGRFLGRGAARDDPGDAGGEDRAARASSTGSRATTRGSSRRAGRWRISSRRPRRSTAGTRRRRRTSASTGRTPSSRERSPRRRSPTRSRTGSGGRSPPPPPRSSWSSSCRPGSRSGRFGTSRG